MLVVVSTRHDPEAHSLVARWASYGAVLLTCEDLSVRGWRHYLEDDVRSVAMLGGDAIPVAEIDGVLTRWPAIYPQELAQIIPDDRNYVASEMTAFLRSWLHQLKCPVLNRPTATSLGGPGWRPEQWIHVAGRNGIPVRPVVRRCIIRPGTTPVVPLNPPHTKVTVVGKQCFGDVDPILADRARHLAKIAGAELLAVHFSSQDRDSPMLTADPMPDLSDDDIADAVLDYFLSRSGRADC